MKVKKILFSFLLLLAGSSNAQNKQKDPFLDSLSRHTFQFFWDLGNTSNGQIPDRWPNETFSSIAATGFGLAGYIVGVEKGYITRQQAVERVLTTLRFLKQLPKGPEKAGVAGYKGFFYHFLYQTSGLRFKEVELSTIDTGLLMAGILACMSYFDQDSPSEKELRQLADQLYLAVEWDWAMDGQEVMSMGWHPEKGFIESDWEGYNEAMVLYLMAIGSPSHPIPASSWQAWTKSYVWRSHLGQDYLNFGPLFGHQYSHCFVDFRGIKDDYMRAKGIDYFENSRRATLANHRYCSINPGAFTGYSPLVWGLTACDGPGNRNNADPNIRYMDYGARGVAYGYLEDDGTIAPTAAGGSIPFAPEICIPALKYMKHTYPKIYNQYGFIDAFNLNYQHKDGTTGWYDPDQLGIDQGPILLQIANYESEIIWKVMKKNPYIQKGLQLAGFK